MRKLLLAVFCLLVCSMAYGENMVSDVYPNLDLPVLKWARLTKLDGKNILKSDDLTYTESGLIEEIKAKYPEMLKEAENNLLFFLEESLGRRLLIASAKKEGHTMQNEEEAIMQFLLSKVKDIKVEDGEVKKFYDETLAGIEGMSFEKVREQAKMYLLNLKKKQAIQEFLVNFGKDKNIQVDKAWFEKHLKKLNNNPVDEARSSGRITFVQFGTDGCEPCELMRPFIKELGDKYKNKKNIVFVDVTKNKILAVRYGVEMVPVQTFYDKSGKEVFRHVGFFSKEQIEKKLSEIEQGGVKSQ
jgi:thiol-disulfide isomerase/thioredoxin